MPSPGDILALGVDEPRPETQGENNVPSLGSNVDADPRLNYYTRLLQILWATELVEFYHIRHQPNTGDLLKDARSLLTVALKYIFIDSSNNAWWQARWLNQDEKYSCVDVAPYFKGHERFFEDLRAFLHKTHDDSLTVQQSLRALWIWFMERAETDEVLAKSEAPVAELWNKLHESEKEEYLRTFDFDEETVARWFKEIDSREVENPDFRQCEEYTDGFEAFQADPENEGIYRYFGHLGGELWRCHFTLWEARCRFRDGVELWSNVELDKTSNKWVEDVWSLEDLKDLDCPVCYIEYKLPGLDMTWGDLDTRPVKAACGHITCSRCYQSWVTSGRHNAYKCPLCRSKLRPIGFQTDWEHWNDFWKAYKDVNDETPQEHAERIVEGLDRYLESLPQCLRQMGRLEPSDEHLKTLTNVALGPTEKVMPWIRKVFPHNQTLINRTFDSEFHAGIESLRCYRDRLKAFMEGDVKQYRLSTARELRVFAQRELMHFIIDADEWDESLRHNNRDQPYRP